MAPHRSGGRFTSVQGSQKPIKHLWNVARKVFYKDLIDESSGERKKLFSVTKRLLGVERDTQYPPIKDKVVLK